MASALSYTQWTLKAGPYSGPTDPDAPVSARPLHMSARPRHSSATPLSRPLSTIVASPDCSLDEDAHDKYQLASLYHTLGHDVTMGMVYSLSALRPRCGALSPQAAVRPPSAMSVA